MIEKENTIKLLEYQAHSRTEDSFADAREYIGGLNKLGFNWESVKLIKEQGFNKFDKLSANVEDTKKSMETNPVLNQVFHSHIGKVYEEVLRLEKNRLWHEENKKSNSQNYVAAPLPSWKRFYENLQYWRHQEFNIGLVVGAVAAISLVALCK